MALIRNKNFSSLSFLAMCSLSSLEVIRYKFYLGLRSLASNSIPVSVRYISFGASTRNICTTTADQHSLKYLVVATPWSDCAFSIGLTLNSEFSDPRPPFSWRQTKMKSTAPRRTISVTCRGSEVNCCICVASMCP